MIVLWWCMVAKSYLFQNMPIKFCWEVNLLFLYFLSFLFYKLKENIKYQMRLSRNLPSTHGRSILGRIRRRSSVLNGCRGLSGSWGPETHRGLPVGGPAHTTCPRPHAGSTTYPATPGSVFRFSVKWQVWPCSGWGSWPISGPGATPGLGWLPTGKTRHGFRHTTLFLSGISSVHRSSVRSNVHA